MSKRLLAILGLVAALGLGTPARTADHGEKDKHQHGNKHNDWDDAHAWERRGRVLVSRLLRSRRPSADEPREKDGAGQLHCHRVKPRNMAAEPMCISSVPFTTTRMGGL